MNRIGHGSLRRPRAVTILEMVVAFVVLVVLGILISVFFVGGKTYANNAVQAATVFILAAVVGLRIWGYRARRADGSSGAGRSEVSEPDAGAGV